MWELATLLRNEGIEAAISTPHCNFSISILLLSQSKKLRTPVVQTCNILRQLIYTEKQIISTLKTQSLDLKHGVANVTYIHKFLYILICKSACEKLIWVQVLWNRERSDTYQKWRFPKCMTCMHVPLQVGCIHQKHSQTLLLSSQQEGTCTPLSAEVVACACHLPSPNSRGRKYQGLGRRVKENVGHKMSTEHIKHFAPT